MRKLLIAILLIMSFCMGSMAEQKVYKIKPIKGKKSAVVQSEDLGYGMTKWSVTVERVGRTAEIYLPSDVTVFTEGQGYNPPNPSNSLKINSAKTADGFLFNANGPKNNNIKIHLKKSASSNSSYTLEVNLRQGEKYSFPIYYLPNNYLMVMGSSDDYENMISSISSNDYFKEALTYVDDEFSKYQGESNLVWWALSFVGVFQDFVDVEAIGNIVPEAAFSTYFFESQTYYTTWVEWLCNGNYYQYPLEYGQFMIINGEANCQTAATIMGSYLGCKVFKCDVYEPGSAEWQMCMSSCQLEPGGGIDPIPHRPGCGALCQEAYDVCLTFCDNSTCTANCKSAYYTCMKPCRQD